MYVEFPIDDKSHNLQKANYGVLVIGNACRHKIFPSFSGNLSPTLKHSPTKEKVAPAHTNGHAIKTTTAYIGQLSYMQQEKLVSRLLRQHTGALNSGYAS